MERTISKKPAVWRASTSIELDKRHVVVAVHGAHTIGIAPIPCVLIGVFRRALELPFRDAGPITSDAGIILQRLPRQRIVIITDTEEAAKAKHGVRDFSAHLVDHDALDRTDLLIIGAIDGGAFNLVTSDEIRRFTCFGDHVGPPLSYLTSECLTENAAGSEGFPR